MTDEAGKPALRDNYEQAVALGTARHQSRSLLPVHRRMIADFEKRGQLDRTLEALPTDEDLDARAEAGQGLTTPEFSVLLAYVKILTKHEVEASTLPDAEWTSAGLVDYFPNPLPERY